jgi:hypothetical protein
LIRREQIGNTDAGLNSKEGRQAVRFLCALLLVAIAAGTSRSAAVSSAGQAGGGGRSPSRIRVSTATPSLRISQVSMIPAAAPRTEIEAYCRNYLKVPTTGLGRDIVRQGWHLISEEQLGGHIAAVYVRGLIASTSSICFPVDGHVAIAEGNRVIAIISNARPVRADMGEYGIGDIDNVPGSHNFRITEGTATPPIAEVRIGSDSIRIGRLAPADAICRGRASVPNVFDRPISSASRALLRAGWRPLRGRLGLRECSGTGVGYCLFTYRQGRRSLDIVTVGDERHVVNYEPHC